MIAKPLVLSVRAFRQDSGFRSGSGVPVRNEISETAGKPRQSWKVPFRFRLFREFLRNGKNPGFLPHSGVPDLLPL
jgi:hypothetical protein